VAKGDDPIYAVTERQFQRSVTALAKAAGWSYWHVSDARRAGRGGITGDASVAGLTDLVMAHPTRGLVFAELKRQDGKLRDSQRKALAVLAPAALAARNVRVHVWRPADYDDVIVPVLTTGRGPILHGVP
jgi:hypothetical protein